MAEPRIAYYAEGGYHHSFPIEALHAVWPGPVLVGGGRLAKRLGELAPDCKAAKAEEISPRLRELKTQVLVSTSQRLTPGQLRSAVPDLRVVFVGHGESDKVHGPGRAPAFARSEVNLAFDLLLVGSRAHAEMSGNPNTIQIGSLKHDLFVARGFDTAVPDPTHVLWAPTWGRQSSVRPWLDAVIRATEALGLRCCIHLHPFSHRFEPRIAQRVQVEVLRHRHVRLAHVTDLLLPMSRSAVMLADVSAACYDWLFFDRPLLFLSHAGIASTERGLFDAGTVLDTPVALVDALGNALAQPDRQSDRRREALAGRFDELNGRAAQRAKTTILEYWNAHWRP